MRAPRSATQSQSILSVSARAAAHIAALIDRRGKHSLGVRVSLKTKGCTGMAYALTYVDQVEPKDHCIKDQGVTVYVDPAAVLFLIGTEMDFNEDPLSPGFVFNNPNEKGRCGCGQSFHV